MSTSVARTETNAPASTSSGRALTVAISLVGLGVSMGLVWVALRRVDWPRAQAILTGMAWWPSLPLAVLAYLVGHVVRGVRCAMLVRRHASLDTVAATNIVVAGYASNNVFPARLGELVRVGLLSARTGLPVWHSLSITLLERVVDGLVILGLLAVATLNLDVSDWVHNLTRVALAVLGTAGLGLAALAVWPKQFLALASRLGHRLGRRPHDVLVGLVSQVTAGVGALRDPRFLFRFLGLSVAVWCLESLMFVALFGAFGLPTRFFSGALVMGITNLGILLPSTPGFVGTFHYFCGQALQSQGASAELAFSYAIVAHLAFFVPITLWGAWVLLTSGVRVGATVAAVRSARTATQTQLVQGLPVHVISREPAPLVVARPGVFLGKLVEAIVASHRPTEAVDGRALAIAVDFTHGQLGALPVVLQFAFWTGMGMFRTWVTLRYLRPFSWLDLATRQRAMESWAFGRIGLLRTLLRPVRGVALLAYWETKEHGR